MGLFSGGLIFGSFFVHRILGLIFGWAYFRVGLLSGNYGRLRLGSRVPWAHPNHQPSTHVNISKVSNCEKLPQVGFEPTTFGLQDRCAYLLRHRGTELRAR